MSPKARKSPSTTRAGAATQATASSRKGPKRRAAGATGASVSTGLRGGNAGARNKRTTSKAERRAQLLESATAVFAQRGYARTTVDDITQAAGVARGTFYLYFDDKRDVFQELVDRFADRITLAIIRIATDDPSRPVADQVVDNIRGILGVCLHEREMTKILFTGAVGTDSEFEHKLTRFYDEVVQLLTESLKDGQALGIVAPGEPRVLAYMTIGALKELLYQAVTLGLSDESTEALTKQVYGFLRSGYLRVEEPGAAPKKSRVRRV